MLKHVDVAVYDDHQGGRRWRHQGRHRSRFDLKVDGVGYSTSGGFVDDIKDKLDGLQGRHHQRQDRGSDEAAERRPHVLTEHEPGAIAPRARRVIRIS